ncbi:hypothetical protein Q9251_08205 [Alkalihalobacillus macyae]|nr:hypothetical protein [Alkalihalobacillus macyae]MDP4550865.1 hypothetical protein [Alkalihalobacillus macyae]
MKNMYYRLMIVLLQFLKRMNQIFMLIGLQAEKSIDKWRKFAKKLQK